ncbi:MAG: DUF1178 family protein [Methylocella sp.]
MIKFSLVCGSGHEFESWFRSGASYDDQVQSGLVLCPVCQTSSVVKSIMAPAVALHGRDKLLPAQGPSPAERGANVALIDNHDRQLRTMIEDIRNRILEHTEDVGTAFAEEARKIHDGIVPDRAIHGQASPEEARALIDDGVKIMPIPRLPDDFN